MGPPLGHVVGGGTRAGRPIRRVRNCTFHTDKYGRLMAGGDDLAQRPIVVMAGCVEDRAAERIGIGVEELQMSEFLGMGLKQPGVINHGEQDQRLARRHA